MGEKLRVGRVSSGFAARRLGCVVAEHIWAKAGTRERMQRRTGGGFSEDPFAASEELPPEFEANKKVAKAYARRGTPPWIYVAVGVVFGMLMICLIYYVHSSRAAAELAKHEAESEHIWNSDLHDDLHDMSDKQHAEL